MLDKLEKDNLEEDKLEEEVPPPQYIEELGAEKIPETVRVLISNINFFNIKLQLEIKFFNIDYISFILQDSDMVVVGETETSVIVECGEKKRSSLGEINENVVSAPKETTSEAVVPDTGKENPTEPSKENQAILDSAARWWVHYEIIIILTSSHLYFNLLSGFSEWHRTRWNSDQEVNKNSINSE